ncbi:hypothetical protein MBLNU457_5146t1 [Dothideomycetes sp. NU457]
MPPFRRHLLYLTTEQSSDDEQWLLTSATSSPAQLKPTTDDSILVTPVPPSSLIASLHTRPPPSFQTSGALNSEQKCERDEGVYGKKSEATWPLPVAAHNNELTDHHGSTFDDKGGPSDAVSERSEQFRTSATECCEGRSDTTQTVRNFSRPFRSTTASLSNPSSDVSDAKVANSVATTATIVKTSPSVTNAMKETQSTRAKRKSLSSPIASQQRRDWSAVSKTSTPDKSPLAASSFPAQQNDKNAETRNVVARSQVSHPGPRTSSLPSPRSRFSGGGSFGSVGPRLGTKGGTVKANAGSDVQAPGQKSLKRQRSSHASQASLNERYRQQESNESPRSPPKNVPGLIGIAWSGIADEWWPPRSSSRCRYTQTARNSSNTHTAHRLSSINELKEDLTTASEQKHDRSTESQMAQFRASPQEASRSADASRGGIDRQDTPNRTTGQIGADRTSKSEKRRSQDRATEKPATKNNRKDTAKDVWGSTIVIKKRREGEMMRVREKAVWW